MRLFLLLLLLVASAPSGLAQEEGYMLHIVNYVFAPSELEVLPGSTIIAMNFGKTDPSIPDEDTVHTVTPVTAGLWQDPGPEGRVPADQRAHTFQAPAAEGRYPYYCRFHGDKEGNGMAGVLVVSKDAPPLPTQPPPPTPTPEEERDSPLAAPLALVALGAAVLFARRR